MAKQLTVQTNFTAGELSPRLYAHVDLAKYRNALKTATNCDILPHGPIKRRNGFKFIAEAKDSTKKVRLLRFQYDALDSYILEFGHQYIRFYKNGGQVLTTPGTDISNGTFTTDLTDWDDRDLGSGTSSWSSPGVMSLAVSSTGGLSRRTQDISLGAGEYTLNFTTALADCKIKIGTAITSAAFVNGFFETDLSNWTSGDVGSTAVSSWSNGKMSLAKGNQPGNSTYARRYQAVNLSSGTYKINFTSDSATVQLSISTTLLGPPGSGSDLGTFYSSVGDNTISFTAPGGDVYFTFANEIENTTKLVSNVYIEAANEASILNTTASVGSNTVNFTAPGGTIYITFSNIISSTTSTIDDVYLGDNDGIVTVNTTYTESEIFDITYTQFGRYLYLYHGSHPPAKLIWNSATDWDLETITFRPPATEESGVSPTGITLTPAATTGTGVNFTTSADYWRGAAVVGRQIINLAGSGIASITSVSSGTVAVATIIEAFPSTSAIAAGDWKLDLSPITSLTPSGYKEGAQITLTASGSTFKSENGTNYYVLIHNGVVRILSYTSETVAVGIVEKSLDSVAATENWSFESASWSNVNGYPRTVALHQARLFSASTDDSPQTVWATETGIYDSIGIGDADSDALNFDISMRDASQVNWMMNLRGQLALGTASGELTLDSGSSTGSVTPSSLVQQVRGYHGSNLQQPIGLSDEVIYIEKSKLKINAFRYNFEIDNYTSEDLLFLAEHMPKGGIKELAYASDPDRHLYAVLNNGDILVCTYVRDQNVLGWSRYTTDGSFESINTIRTGDHDEVWVVVRRLINGAYKRYIERLDLSYGETNIDGFSDSYLTYSRPKTISSITNTLPGVVSAIEHGFSNGDYIKIVDVKASTVDEDGDTVYVDYEGEGRTYKVTNKTTDTFELYTTDDEKVDTTNFSTFVSGNVHKLVSTISNLEHLEGKKVQIKVDGAIHRDKIVTSGSITLDQKAYEVTVGLPYLTTIKTLAKEFPAPGTNVSAQGQQMRWVRPILRIYNSCIPTLNGEILPARSAQNLMNSALNLFTGDLVYGDLTWKDGFSSNLEITINYPLPFILLGIFGSIESGMQ